MEEVEYQELDYWGWECPKCEHWIETQDDPADQDTVFCDACGEEFEPVSWLMPTPLSLF